MISIDRLSDDDLLEIFHLYVDEARNQYALELHAMMAWQRLVHVCRRWRSIVFGSPRRLNLQLVCADTTLARCTVDVWPALPILIQDPGYIARSTDNIIALLERSDLVCRVSEIKLWKVLLEDISEAMQVPFPELTHLDLYHNGQTALPLPDSFLGGSAPQLRSLKLHRVPYPGLPKLLLSATHLTRLDLYGIPVSGYIPPETMAACLSTLTSLEQLFLQFQFPRPLPDQGSQSPPPSIRTSLPVLSHLSFQGGSEYLEVLVARVDAPRLRDLDISFFNDIVFVTPKFTRFISHIPTFEAFNVARLGLWDSHASITLSYDYEEYGEGLNVSVYCTELDWQLSFLEQVCTSSLPPHSTLQELYIEGRPCTQGWIDNIDYEQWLELLHSFSTVTDLYLSKELAPCVVPALQNLVEGRTTGVFPTLENIFLEELQESGPVREGIGKFVAARQVTSHPVTVSRWDRDSN